MRRFVVASATAAALLSFGLGDSLAHADNAPPPAESAPAAPDATSVVTLPLFGSPLVADVTTDAGGGLVDVTLTPAEGYDPAKVRPNKVAFVNEAQGVIVKVTARHGGERVEARAGSLADVSGPGGWSGDVFDTGEPTNVGFTIAAGADGGPDITGITVDSTLEHVIGEVERNSGADPKDPDETHQSAKATIEFTRSGQTRWLTIKAVLVSDDGETRSALKVSLSRVRGRMLADGEAVGPHSWSGQLCDGTAASFTYVVSETGEITDVVATPAAEVRGEGHRVKVVFGDRQRVSIKVRSDDGVLTVSTDESFRCGRNDPTVNGVAVEPPADDDGDDGKPDGWWNDGDHDRDHDRDRDRDRDRNDGRDGGGGGWGGDNDHHGDDD